MNSTYCAVNSTSCGKTLCCSLFYACCILFSCIIISILITWYLWINCLLVMLKAQINSCCVNCCLTTIFVWLSVQMLFCFVYLGIFWVFCWTMEMEMPKYIFHYLRPGVLTIFHIYTQQVYRHSTYNMFACTATSHLLMPLHLLWTHSLHREHLMELLPTSIQQTCQISWKHHGQHWRPRTWSFSCWHGALYFPWQPSMPWAWTYTPPGCPRWALGQQYRGAPMAHQPGTHAKALSAQGWRAVG